MEQKKVDLDALEAALAKSTPGRYLVPDDATGQERNEILAVTTGMNALPALIAELRELRAYHDKAEAIFAGEAQ